MRYALTFTAVLVSLCSTGTKAAAQEGQPDLIWEGEVISAATLFIQGDRVDVQGRGTGAVDRPSARFRTALPHASLRASARVRSGSGRVTIAEQPSPANEYALIVDIDNRGTPPQYYVIDFYWDEHGGSVAGVQQHAEERDRRPGSRAAGSPGSVTWSGEVDHEAVVTLRGQRANARPVKGKPVQGDYARFTSPIPRSEVSLRLVEVRGRGKVELIEEPNAQNNYSVKVRILDSQGGSGSYTFTLAWEPLPLEEKGDSPCCISQGGPTGSRYLRPPGSQF